MINLKLCVSAKILLEELNIRVCWKEDSTCKSARSSLIKVPTIDQQKEALQKDVSILKEHKYCEFINVTSFSSISYRRNSEIVHSKWKKVQLSVVFIDSRLISLEASWMLRILDRISLARLALLWAVRYESEAHYLWKKETLQNTTICYIKYRNNNKQLRTTNK